MSDVAVNLNVRNFAQWRGRPRQDFVGIRFDTNNTCNVHCVYCHIDRSDERIDLEEFREFLRETVAGTDLFQFGCQMEPTLDDRLVDFMQSVHDSAAAPRKLFRLQTNGILLHRHDAVRMRDAGLNFLAVSVDSDDPTAMRELRGGTSVKKVYRNVEAFHKICPQVKVAFITTVTARNIDLIRPLIVSGLDVGVSTFNLRQVSYNRRSDIVDHSRMSALVVSDGAFEAMAGAIKAEFGKRAYLAIQGSSALHALARATREASEIADD
jgi:molybdenum cofactor biosynthesis enzyme MoaA